MKHFLIAALFTIISGAAFAAAGVSPTPAGDGTPFQLVSIDLTEGEMMPQMYVADRNGCDGKNYSPALSWSYPPDGTKSYVVTMFDVDGMQGEGWLHWALFNIPANKTILKRNLGSANNPYPVGSRPLPNSWGESIYVGPCPPTGDKPHKYVFSVFAMPTEDVAYPLNAIGWSTIDWLNENSLGHASVTTYYSR